MKKGDIFIIEYFSHTCYHCKVFKGYYINFAKYIQRNHNDIKLFAIDLDFRDDKDVYQTVRQYNITGVPHVKIFIDSPSNHLPFLGGDASSLHKWLQKTLKPRRRLAPFPKEYCLNSISGPDLITDSKGWICKISDINPTTQCCDVMGEYDYYSICDAHNNKCDEYFPCCIDYTSCIGCCLHSINPQFDGETADYKFHTNDRDKLLKVQDSLFGNFTFCRHQCRSSSKSTFEGNTYIDYRKYYCYEEDVAQYEEPDRLLKQVLPDVNFQVMVGRKGESCTDACHRRSGEHRERECVDDRDAMKYINSCTSIQKYLKNCIGGCMFGYDEALPAFGVKAKRCYLKATVAKQQQNYSCSASNADYKRLCLCKT